MLVNIIVISRISIIGERARHRDIIEIRNILVRLSFMSC